MRSYGTRRKMKFNRSWLAPALFLALVASVPGIVNAAPDNRSPMLVRTGGQPASSASPPPSASAPTLWTLLADAKLESVDLKDSTSSFGLGARYRAPSTETMLIIRKGTADTLTGSLHDHAFGAFILSPDNTKIGITFRLDWFHNSGVYCVEDKPGGNCQANTVVHGLRTGAYMQLKAGMADITSTAAGLTSASLAAGALGVGFSGRFEDEFVLDGTSRPLVLGFWFGPTVRLIGGDLTEDQRQTLLGSGAPVWFGLEAGALLRLGTFDLTGELSWIGFDNSNAVVGLERLQVVPSIKFSLPFDVLSAPASSATAATPEAKPAAENGAAVPPSTTPTATASTTAGTGPTPSVPPTVP